MFGSEQSCGMVSFKAKLYYALFGHDHMGYRVRAFHVKKMLARNNNLCHILDAGSGEGTYSFWLSKRYPHAYISAIDIDGGKIAHCNSMLNRLKRKNLNFEQGNLVDYEYPKRYNLVTLIDVLEHIWEDERVLFRLKESLQSDGILILHVPQRHQQNTYHFKNFKKRLGRQSDHVRDEYTEEEILEKIEKTGLEIIEKRYTFGWFGSLSREIFYKVEELHNLRPICKLLLAPLLILSAYLDTLTPNKIHQGFLFKLKRKAK